MKRDLRFRVWEKLEKKMSYSDMEFFDDMIGFRFDHFGIDTNGIDDNGCFWFSGEGYTDCNWHFYNKYEIIGNVFETPELLKV